MKWLLIIVILVAILLLFSPIGTKLKENVRPGTARLIMLVLVAVIIFAAWKYWSSTKVFRNGEIGKDGYAAPSVANQSGTNSAEIEVRVYQSNVTVNKKLYSNTEDALLAISEYVAQKGVSIRLVDDYALNSTYLEVRKGIEKIGAKITNEIEVQ